MAAATAAVPVLNPDRSPFLFLLERSCDKLFFPLLEPVGVKHRGEPLDGIHTAGSRP